MKDIQLDIRISQCQPSELTEEERSLLNVAIQATNSAYAPYSQFQVGAAVLLTDGTTINGCNQENAAFPAGICAERSAIFAAGAQHPNTPIKTLAIAARRSDGTLTEQPVTPCGTCRQVIVETERRFKLPIRIILYGTRCIYVAEGIQNLMPLSFTEF